MDRLDAWLSAQRGWRLLLVRCAALVPFGLVAGSLWSNNVTYDPATQQVRALVARIALCVAASLALAALTLAPRRWRVPARRPGRTWPAWRVIAGLYSFMAYFAVEAYAHAEPPAFRRHNGWVFALELAFLGVYGVMIVWNARYMRRLRHATPSHSCSSPSPLRDNWHGLPVLCLRCGSALWQVGHSDEPRRNVGQHTCNSK